MNFTKPQAKLAVDVIYQNLNNLPHPDHGVLRMTYFGHASEGQQKITRATAEALVMLLEANGFFLCNGLSEAAALLAANGWAVEAPGEAPEEGSGEGSGEDSEDSGDVPAVAS